MPNYDGDYIHYCDIWRRSKSISRSYCVEFVYWLEMSKLKEITRPLGYITQFTLFNNVNTSNRHVEKLFSESGCEGEGKKLFAIANFTLFCLLESQTRKAHIVGNLELNVW